MPRLRWPSTPSGTWVGVEACKNADSIGDVWTSGDGQIHECTNCTEVRGLAHEFYFIWSGGSHGSIKTLAWIHGSEHRVAICEFEALKHVENVLALAKGNGAVGAVSGDLYAKKE